MKNTVFVLVVLLPALTCQARIITVDDDLPADFNNIQAAIDDSNDGDEVHVRPGTYYETVVMKDGVDLRSTDGPDVTIIDAEEMYSGSLVSAENIQDPNTTLSGFTLRNTRFLSAGVGMGGSYMIIERNIIYGHGGCSPPNPLSICGGGGIIINDSVAMVRHNIIYGNSGGGICIYNYTLSIPSTILNNIVIGNDYGIDVLWDTADHNLFNNDVWDNGTNYSGVPPGPGDISEDPLFVAIGEDHHLKSEAGRYDPNTSTWVVDSNTSPCIDAGNPMSPIGLEPFPNGGIINMGAYGGTVEASKSYFGKPPCEIIVAGDINGDCIVDFRDFSLMSLHWLQNYNP